ncbi:MAG: TatD family hydrolase [Verrucomicrobiae bacterium]|nr:TatD family hydrolase [Verrucomicrobiae bacterium]
MELIETHAHLDYADFDPDREVLLQKAAEAGVRTILSIGTRGETSRRAVDLAQKYANVFAVVGWHPTDCREAPDDVLTPLRELASHPKVAAIGETGLDYYRLPSQEQAPSPGADMGVITGYGMDQVEADLKDALYKSKQELIFRQQLDLAVERGLNVVVHQRSAFEDCLSIMAEYQGRVRGVWHCFVDAPDRAQRVIGIGSLVSFTGIVTFKNAKEVLETVRAVPLEHMMVETDCPYLAPVPFRGKRCEPAHTRLVAEKIAEIKGVSLDEVARVTTQNAREFFQLRL